MASTQQFLPIEDIKDDLVYLKSGSVSLIISTSAVNFGLLFENEQLSIINSFAGLLNSLSFPIQIVIHSRRLDVSSYLKTLDRAMARQTNPQLKVMTLHYRRFVESIIKEKNVLDKQFYVCLSVSGLEMGILPKSLTDRSKKALTILIPRRDHLIRQLARLGLKAHQLKTEEVIKLYYDTYNPIGADVPIPIDQSSFVANQLAKLNPPTPLPNTSPPIKPPRVWNIIPKAQFVPPQLPTLLPKQPGPINPPPFPYTPQPPAPTPFPPLPFGTKPASSRTGTPFVVEELED